MIRRTIEATLASLLQAFPAVALLGPRQSGKTTLALALAGRPAPRSIYVDLELPSDRAKLSDPELYFSEHADQLVILDEIHRLPDLFATLRGVIDRRRREGKAVQQFLLLGSASIDLMQQSSESLAGRIAYLELTPFTAQEVRGTGAAALDALSLPATVRASFYRTSAGAEIDLVLEHGSNEVWAFEVKRSLGSLEPGKGFYIGCEDVKATRRIVIYPGGETFGIGGETTVMPLERALAELQQTAQFG